MFDALDPGQRSHTRSHKSPEKHFRLPASSLRQMPTCCLTIEMRSTLPRAVRSSHGHIQWMTRHTSHRYPYSCRVYHTLSCPIHPAHTQTCILQCQLESRTVKIHKTQPCSLNRIDLTRRQPDGTALDRRLLMRAQSTSEYIKTSCMI